MMNEKQKEIADLKNEISYLNALLDLSLDSAFIAMETSRKLIEELKTIRNKTNQH